jgi:DNA-binding phage protein
MRNETDDMNKYKIVYQDTMTSYDLAEVFETEAEAEKWLEENFEHSDNYEIECIGNE